MEGDGKRAREVDELSSTVNVHVASGIEDAKHHAVRACRLGSFDVAAHDVEFFIPVAKIAGARPNDGMQPDRYPGSNDFHEPETGSDATLEQIIAQLNPLRSTALGSHGG